MSSKTAPSFVAMEVADSTKVLSQKAELQTTFNFQVSTTQSVYLCHKHLMLMLPSKGTVSFVAQVAPPMQRKWQAGCSLARHFGLVHHQFLTLTLAMFCVCQMFFFFFFLSSYYININKTKYFYMFIIPTSTRMKSRQNIQRLEVVIPSHQNSGVLHWKGRIHDGHLG